MTVAGRLAERIVALSAGDIGERAAGNARMAIADTIAVALAGAREDCVVLARRAAGIGAAGGPCTLLGHGGGAQPLDAAFVNGIAAHALDYDDCSNTVGGHPSAPVLPAVLAAAEVRAAPGREALVAYVAGFETMAKLGRAVHFHHYRKGWHPTATLGTFGAAAGAARILGLDARATATALAVACSLASGVKANFGTMTKSLHVGHCARNGLLAARLAAEGYTARESAFEHEQGFFEVFNGAGTYDAERIFDTWAAPLDVESPGVAIKAYPCCGSTHPAIDAVLVLRARHGLRPDAIEGVEIRTHARRLAHTNRPDPKSDLDAKFSVQYVAARALADGRVGLDHFEGEAHREPRVRALMARVAVATHEDENHFGAYATVRTRDGRELRHYVPTPLGRDESNPLPPERRRAKLDDCAGRVLDPRRAAALWSAVDRLDALADVRELTRLARPAGATAGAAAE